MKIKDYLRIESATDLSRSEVGRLGTAILFVVGVVIYTGTRFDHVDQLYLLVAAAVIGAYMAMNIGANDVANNVGPSVGVLRPDADRRDCDCSLFRSRWYHHRGW